MKKILSIITFTLLIALSSCATYSGKTSSVNRKNPNVESSNGNKNSTQGTGRTYNVHTGTRGGKYYINSNGDKTYIKKGYSGSTYRTKSTRRR